MNADDMNTDHLPPEWREIHERIFAIRQRYERAERRLSIVTGGFVIGIILILVGSARHTPVIANLGLFVLGVSGIVSVANFFYIDLTSKSAWPTNRWLRMMNRLGMAGMGAGFSFVIAEALFRLVVSDG